MRYLQYLRCTCEKEHVTRVEPTLVTGGQARFNSAANWCSHVHRKKPCEAKIVKTHAVYGSKRKFEKEYRTSA